SVTRPTLTREEVERNAETYREQAFKILDQSKTEIVYNGSWLGKLSFEDVIRLNSNVTLQQLLQREHFRARMKSEQPIHAHEIQYPIMQAYDSVMVKADVELGGTDQLFNILLGRDLQKQNGQPQQIVLLTPILEGLDGKQKMSKSLGNYVALNDSPAEMFGKLMSISDELMVRYYLLLLSRELPKNKHPLQAKKERTRQQASTSHTASGSAPALWRFGNRLDGITRFHHPRAMSKHGIPWPHAPMHQLSENGTYFVTAGTYLKAHHFRGSDRLRVLHRGLLTVAQEYGWLFEAWAVFSNHYHFVAHSAARCFQPFRDVKRL